MGNAESDEVTLQQWLKQLVELMKSERWLIVSLVLLGVAAGLLHARYADSQYEGTMMVSTSRLSEFFVHQSFETLNTHLEEGNYELVAKSLNILPEEARALSSLKVYLDWSSLKTGLDAMSLHFTARSTNPYIFGTLEKGILFFMANNDVFKAKIDQRKTFNEQMITRLKSEIADLEEFKTRVMKGDKYQGLSFDPTVINTKILELTKEILESENDLQNVQTVYVVSGFPLMAKKVSPGKWAVGATGGFFGLMLAISVLTLKRLSAQWQPANRDQWI